jgi:hypothetical protein
VMRSQPLSCQWREKDLPEAKPGIGQATIRITLGVIKLRTAAHWVRAETLDVRPSHICIVDTLGVAS